MCLHSTIPLSTSAFSTPKRHLIAHKECKLAVSNTPPPPNTSSLTTKEEEVSHISPDWDMLVYSTPIASIQNDSPPEMPPLKRGTTTPRQQILDFDFLDEHDTLGLSLPSLVRMTGSCSTKHSTQDEIFIPCKLSSERMGFRPRIIKNVE